jgi:hypothetical protein
MRRDELAAAIAGGHAIDLAALRGPYRGVSLGLGAVIERLSWKTFRKRFWLDEASGDVVGHNERLEQTGLDGPVTPQRDRRGAIVSFGPFRVVPLPEGGTPFHCRAGLLLDYGARHPAWHPLARVRDPIVAVNEGSLDLLLGASYLDLGGIEPRTPSFFTLERER